MAASSETGLARARVALLAIGIDDPIAQDVEVIARVLDDAERRGASKMKLEAVSVCGQVESARETRGLASEGATECVDVLCVLPLPGEEVGGA